LEFPLKALLDRAFIFPEPLPEKHESKEKLIEIPEQFREYYQRGIGYLLAIGPGYWDLEGKWHLTSPQLQPGVKVLYDISVPWSMWVKDDEGREHLVTRCGASDIWCVVED